MIYLSKSFTQIERPTSRRRITKKLFVLHDAADVGCGGFRCSTVDAICSSCEEPESVCGDSGRICEVECCLLSQDSSLHQTVF